MQHRLWWGCRWYHTHHRCSRTIHPTSQVKGDVLPSTRKMDHPWLWKANRIYPNHSPYGYGRVHRGAIWDIRIRLQSDWLWHHWTSTEEAKTHQTSLWLQNDAWMASSRTQYSEAKITDWCVSMLWHSWWHALASIHMSQWPNENLCLCPQWYLPSLLHMWGKGHSKQSLSSILWYHDSIYQ